MFKYSQAPTASDDEGSLILSGDAEDWEDRIKDIRERERRKDAVPKKNAAFKRMLKKKADCDESKFYLSYY